MMPVISPRPCAPLSEQDFYDLGVQSPFFGVLKPLQNIIVRALDWVKQSLPGTVSKTKLDYPVQTASCAPKSL